MQLYEGKGDLVEQLLNDTHTKSQNFVQQERTFKVTPVGPMVASEPLADEGKNPAYFFQLYCDGVRELTFLPKVSKDELRNLALVFNGDYKGSQDDMVTTLWKKDFKIRLTSTKTGKKLDLNIKFIPQHKRTKSDFQC